MTADGPGAAAGCTSAFCRWREQPRKVLSGSRPRSAARVQANQGSAGATSATGWSSTTEPRASASAQTKAGSRLNPEPLGHRGHHGPEIGGHQAQVGGERPAEGGLPEPAGQGQLGAVGHPRPATNHEPERSVTRRGRPGASAGEPTRTNRRVPMGRARCSGAHAPGWCWSRRRRARRAPAGRRARRPVRTGRRGPAPSGCHPGHHGVGEELGRRAEPEGRGPAGTDPPSSPTSTCSKPVEGLGHLGVELPSPPGRLDPLGRADEQGKARPTARGRPAAGWPPAGTGSAGTAPPLTDPDR